MFTFFRSTTRNLVRSSTDGDSSSDILADISKTENIFK